MNKKDYFIKALKEGRYKYRDWVLSIFSVSKQTQESEYPKDPYPYRLVIRDDGLLYYVDLEKNGDLTLIEGYVKDQPLFSVKERLVLEKGDLPNVTKTTNTTYGNAIFNAIAICWPFGNAIDYLEGRVNGNRLNKLIVSRLKDNPDISKGELSVSQLKDYCEAMGALAGYTQLCVPAASPKSLTIDPAIIKRRDELLEIHKDNLKDPVVIAKIEKELVDMDKASFKGDPASGFLLGGKAFDTTRKKLFIMEGLEGGFGSPTDMAFIPKSLKEGWDINNLPAMSDSGRFGSYNRGALTALGGESVKYFHRVFQNTKIAEPDCGDKVGLRWTINGDNYDRFDGLYLIEKDNLVELNSEITRRYIGKEIRVRSPMSCKTKAPSFCERCMGNNLSRSPTSLLINASDVGSKFMAVFLANAHGSSFKTEKVNLDQVLS